MKDPIIKNPTIAVTTVATALSTKDKILDCAMQ
jgi:hypothetical protein